ncbi:hypothetical protein sos41_42930 [Alphaproteobacteria bacterium SO-S41]|nr:hypothetical protein sos41_42930 [Alphaproteobacteria bacterium SO-S41]
MENDTAGRVRYAVSYGQVTEDADGKSDIISLVEVRRYNLGPLIHKATEDDYGKENTAEIAEFGVGPDVAWRFAFSSVMGNLALPLSISRKVIGDGVDQMTVDPNDLCPTGPCRGPQSTYDFDVKTVNPKAEAATPSVVPDIGTPRYSATVDGSADGVASAALVVRTLSAMLKLTEPKDMAGVWHTPVVTGVEPGTPFVTFQIDQELGNGGGTAALGAVTHTGDPKIAELWAFATFNTGIPPYEPHTQIVHAN